MSYYKITYESNTIEGLKAIQGSFPGNGASASDSTNLETAVPSPPPTQNEENADALTSLVQAPPAANEAMASSNFSDENSFPPPPPVVSDSKTVANNPETEIPPPPQDELQNQEGNEAKPGEGFVPPRQSVSKGPKTP